MIESIDNNIFWQANFWGIVGTVSGALGLLISWLNWRYSKPHIRIAELILTRPSKTQIANYKGKSEEELSSNFLVYKVDIRLRNKKGGAGSIEKPYLVITVLSKKLSLFHRWWHDIRIKPVTSHIETTQISSYLSSSEVIRHGEAWNFNGGQIVDDELEYRIRNPSDLVAISSSYDAMRYSMEYHDNFGRKFRKQIDNIEDDT